MVLIRSKFLKLYLKVTSLDCEAIAVTRGMSASLKDAKPKTELMSPI